MADVDTPTVTSVEAKVDAGWADVPTTLPVQGEPEPASPVETKEAEPPVTADPGQSGVAEPSSTAPTPTEPTKRSDFDYFVSRYKREGMSDEDAREAAARDALDGSNRLADTNRRLQERERELEELKAKATPRQDEPTAEIPEEIAQIKQRLDAYGLEFETAQKDVKALQAKATPLREEIADLDEQIRDPGPNTELGQLEYDRKRKVAKLEGLVRQIRETAARGNAAGQQYDAIVPIHNQAVRLHQIERDQITRREAEQSAEQTAQDTRFRDEFYTVAETLAKDATVGMHESLREEFTRPFDPLNPSNSGYAIRAALAYLTPDPRTGRMREIGDIKAFVQAQAKAYVETAKKIHSGFSAQYADQKLKDAGQTPDNKTGKVATEERRRVSVDEMEERISEGWKQARV